MKTKIQEKTENRTEKLFEKPVLLILSIIVLIALSLFIEAFQNNSKTKSGLLNPGMKTRPELQKLK